MEFALASAIGLLTAAGVYLLLRARSFDLILGLTLLSYATNLLIFASGRVSPGKPPVLRDGVPVHGDEGAVRAGDRLLLRGEWQQVAAVRKARKLAFDHVARDLDGDAGAERLQVEAMVSPGSHLVGHTLAGMRFGHMYRARVHGIHRRRLDIRMPLDQVELTVGDVLLIDAPERAIEDLRAMPIRVLIGDEVSKWKRDLDGEGSALEQAEGRTSS